MLQKPMLAGKFEEKRLRLPIYVQAKFDGIRCLISQGVGYSRTLKPLPNQHIQSWIRTYWAELEGFDGEIIVGNVTARDVYPTTMSGVMSEGGKPDFTFYAFDMWNQEALSFHDRLMNISGIIPNIPTSIVQLVDTPLFNFLDEVYKYERELIATGYEGAILRHPQCLYKQGRASAVSGELLKLKRFIDDEATIEGFDELYRNNNEPTISATGHQVRSSHSANMVPMGMLGALRVVNKLGQHFGIGSGFDMEIRQRIWDNRDNYMGKVVKYKYFQTGGYEVPRFPTFVGFRDPIDI